MKLKVIYVTYSDTNFRVFGKDKLFVHMCVYKFDI